MSKRKERLSEWETFYKEKAKSQVYEKPQGAQGKFTRIYSYMLENKNYIKLTPRAKVCFLYLKDWAYGNKEFRDYGVFPFSPSLLENLGVMTAKIGRMALKELEYYGFIEKANNATYQSGIAQKWILSDKWYREEKPTYKPKEDG